MAITDLTGTTWCYNKVFNDDLGYSSFPIYNLDVTTWYTKDDVEYKIRYSGYFLHGFLGPLKDNSTMHSSNLKSYPAIYTTNQVNGKILSVGYYSAKEAIEEGVIYSGPIYFTIHGGADAKNATLIAWLEENATQVVTAIIKAGTYRFNDMLSAPSAQLEQDIDFTVNVEFEGQSYFVSCGAMAPGLTGPNADLADLQYLFVASEPDLGCSPDGNWGYVYDASAEGWHFPSQTVTIPNNSEVSAEFYEWFTTNTKPVLASIHYNGFTIASLTGGDTATLKCKGMKMEDDVVVEVAEVSGCGTAVATKKDVNFYDYDGTLLYSYTVEEAQALSELPALPERPGLICQGWNWSLENIKAHNRALNVGATYTTDDGTTRIYITLQEGRTSPMLGVCPNGIVIVDWGDGTESDVLTGTDISTVQWTPNHEYTKPGDYVIRLTVDGTMGLAGSSSANAYACILRYGPNSDKRNTAYQNAIQKIELGNGVTRIGGYAFYYCYSLASITIPNGVTYIGGNAFYYCTSLASITFPDGVTSIPDNAFYYCYSLASIIIPDSITFIGSNAFQNCYSLVSITIPNSVTSIGDRTFGSCYSLASITIPDGVTSIGSSAFGNCTSLASITIPDGVMIIGSNAFSQCYSLASITIPDGVFGIASSTFAACYSLASITIPNSIAYIYNSAFQNCSSVRFYDLSRCTVVPTLSSTNAFSGISADCEIRVPTALYDEWIAATNWSTWANYIVAV